MIDKIIYFSIKNKLIVGLFILALIGWGTYSLTQLPVDAVPDITNNQVQIISLSPTLAGNEVEQFITAPIEVAVSNVPDIIELRSISRLGLSVVTVVFKDNVEVYKARQLITERLKEAEEQIPAGLAQISLAPVSTGLGEIYQYILRTKPGFEKKYDAMALREVQDWIVRREILGTPGVADVNSYGGFLKEYEVAVNPARLRGMNITLNDIFSALASNNQNTGSSYIDKKPNAYFIRGLGLVNSFEDINAIVVKSTPDGMPVLIRDVATVQFGHAPRYGAFVADTSGEAVGGVVMMLKGGNASEVVKNVKERIEIVQKSLPEGVYLDPFLDRTDLVSRALGTVSKNLIEGGLIVIFILVLMLGNLRAGLIVASVIPLSMLFAISLMNLFGVSGNLMSLGAIDFGLIVDGAVIIVENVVHRLNKGRGKQCANKLGVVQMDEEVYSAAGRMMGSATFGQIIILIVYLPILALIGIEGKMFRPMAQTVSFAILGALILSLTYVPAISALVLRRKNIKRYSLSDKIMEFISRIFQPFIEFALARKMLVLWVSIGLVVASAFVFSKLGGEFIPTLEEGDLASSIMTLQGGSLTNTIESVEKANKILMTKFPEVEHAICKIGAGEIPTDPTPMETGDYIIVMKPKSEWTSASSREEMMEKMEKELSVLPGVVFELQQPIQMRFNELMTGSKQDVAIKIFGDNLEILADKAAEADKLIQPIEGVMDINVEKVTGSGQVQVTYKRDLLARYGLNVSDVNLILKTAFAGNNAGVVYDQERRFDLVVRFDKDYRQDLEFVKNLYIPLANGGQIPLEQLANVEIRSGVAQISRESAKRRINVGFNVRGRDVQSVITEVRQKLDTRLKLPAGYYVTYGGQFENLVHARNRLAIAVPVALLLIFVLLFFTFHSLRQTFLVFSAVPFAAVGGIFALLARDMNFSISAGIGFIALFGVAVLNGIVLIAEFNRLEKEDGIADIEDRVRKGLKNRLRPVIMTALVASFGFLPMALSSSAGAEVQKPLATVVIGGLLSSTLLTLIVLPVLYILFNRKRKTPFTMPAAVILVLLGFFMMNNPVQLKAQKTAGKYSLEEALALAKAQNRSLANEALKIEMQKKLQGTAWDLSKTDIAFEYGQFNSLRKDNSFNITQSFAFPGQYISQSKLLKAETKRASLEYVLSEQDILAEVKMQYVGLQLLYTKKTLLEYRDSLYRKLFDAVSLRVKTGEANNLEQNSAEVQLMENRRQLDQLRADLLNGQNRLAIILNVQGPSAISDTVLRKAEAKIIPDIAGNQQRSVLSLYMQKSELSRYEKQFEKAKLWPDFSIGYFSQSIVGFQDVNGSPTFFSGSDRFTGIQAGISIPIWFGPQLSRIKASRMKETISRNDFYIAESALNQQIRELNLQLNTNAASLKTFEQKALPQAEAIIRQATLMYKTGEIDFADYVHHVERALSIRESYLGLLEKQQYINIELEKISAK